MDKGEKGTVANGTVKTASAHNVILPGIGFLFIPGPA